ncbi:hypothetical protein BYZ73_18650 [Rhodovulum viride]|uniref:HTH lysR-type domain-containing protein n=1 Tax=Rhodovulum viride TaxID=1231134 RepID=A0ABX9DDA8_9RHOB|nr:hypothetical protein BYZ73_18650 [Rhodovulum viride]
MSVIAAQLGCFEGRPERSLRSGAGREARAVTDGRAGCRQGTPAGRDYGASQIRYFLAASCGLNFTQAAGPCSVTRPALTPAVKRLEEELGGDPFQRRACGPIGPSLARRWSRFCSTATMPPRPRLRDEYRDSRLPRACRG